MNEKAITICNVILGFFGLLAIDLLFIITRTIFGTIAEKRKNKENKGE